MESSRGGSSVIQFDEEPGKTELQFQDFSHGDAATLETSDYGSSFVASPDLESENAGLLEEEKKRSSFWEFSYYQSFFDVDTDQVVQRIIWSMLPVGRSTFLDRVVRPNPDLYGPFWISTTLIFSIAISANIAQYFMTEGEDKRIWHYDFRKVSIAATVIYSYVFLLPLAIWSLMWYRRSSIRYTLLEILCVYGYSLFIYIPVSILWLIQFAWLQWMLVIVGAGMSGLVLAHTFWPTVRDGNKKIAVLALILILMFHSMLAAGFVTFFFRPPHPVRAQSTLISTQTPIAHETNQKLVIMDQKMSSRDTTEKAGSVIHLENATKGIAAESQVIKRKAASSTLSHTETSVSATNQSQAIMVSKNITQGSSIVTLSPNDIITSKKTATTSINKITKSESSEFLKSVTVKENR